MSTEANVLEATRLVSWDDSSLKDIDQAKKKYLEAKRLGKKIIDLQGNEILSFRPGLGEFLISTEDLTEGEFRFHILDESGDRIISWNAKDKKQVKEASLKFNEYMEKGYKAYLIDQKGNRGRRIFSFDVDQEEVVFDDKTTREKLMAFAKKFMEIKLLPKTYPG